MSGRAGKRIEWTNVVVFIVMVSISGCKNNTENPSTEQRPENAPRAVDATATQTDELDGDAIIRAMLERYSAAQSYRDAGVLNLSYRLNGQHIAEPQRWSTAWERRSNRLAVDVFNSRICGNGKILSCFIFDIESANLDNQHRLTAYDSQLPLAALYRDSIARHFLGGYSELPLDESNTEDLPKLIPAPVSLLTGQMRSGWLQNPTRVERLPDATIDDIPCHVVRCLSNEMTADVWIARSSGLLIQMSLPLKLLAGEVITTPDEITDVVLLARYHDAEIDAPIADAKFTIPDRPDASPVKKFVPLPETFPSEMIGHQSPEFQVLTPNGEPRTKLHFDERVTALMWIAGEPSWSAVEQLGEIAKQLPTESFHLATVYGDLDLAQPGSGVLKPHESLSKIATAAGVPVYHDPNLTASQALGMKVIPAVIVFDGNSKVHFARPLSDESWQTDLQAAMRRIAAGDDVAGEMQAEYQRFVASYHQQLETVNAEELVATPGTGLPGLPKKSGRIHPVKSWTNTTFKNAGNLIVVEPNESNDTAFLVFDGWQTVVALTWSGKVLGRHTLTFPGKEGASRIRVGRSNQHPLYALFNPLGTQIHFFDAAWRPAGVFPADDSIAGRITDCQFVNLDLDGETELIVSFHGIGGTYQVNPRSGKSVKLSPLSATSIAPLHPGLAIANGGRIGMLKSGMANAKITDLDFQLVASIDDAALCGVGKTGTGKWNATGFDKSLNRIWTLDVGSQLFESGIQPVTGMSRPDGEFVWAIADSDNVVHIVSGEGKWLGDFQAGNKLSGLGLAWRDGRTFLITASLNGIECWDLGQ